MPKLISLTTALQAKGRYHDSLNLYLDVQKPGVSASWAFLYERDGRQVTLGLGSAVGGRRAKVSRDLARRKAAALITLLAEGKDPKQERQRQRAAGTTFGELLERMLERDAPMRSDPRMAGSWRRSLVQHAGRLLHLPASIITGDDVYAVLAPIWRTIPTRAAQVRQRIETVLNYAVAEGCRPAGPNPARWGGYLEHRLGKRADGGHHASMPFADIPGFMERLRATEGVAARALELLVLTALRSEEVRCARWSEIDLAARRWVIPASRMKGKVQHVVALSEPALRLLKGLPRSDGNDFIFAGSKPGHPIQQQGMQDVLRRLDGDATVHGFRSSLTEWTKATHPHLEPIADWVLAHKPRGAVKQAYSRAQPIEQCGRLLGAWGDYCTGASSRVLRLRA